MKIPLFIVGGAVAYIVAQFTIIYTAIEIVRGELGGFEVMTLTTAAVTLVYTGLLAVAYGAWRRK